MALELRLEQRQGWSLEHRAPASLANALHRAGRLVGSRTGLIHSVVERPAPPGEPPLFHFWATLAHARLWAGHPVYPQGGGCQLERDAACMAAIGEALERYSAGFMGRDHLLVRAPYSELGDIAIDPRSLPLGSEREYAHPHCPAAPYHDNLSIDWVWAASLTQERHALVPACAVFFPYVYPRPEERLLIESTSGLSCGSSREEALLRAALEAIERDAFIITWLNRLPMPTIPHEAITDPRVRRLLDYHRRIGTRIVLKQLRNDFGIPVVLALALDESGRGPALTIGAHASLDPQQAISKAIIEVEQCRLYLIDMVDEGAPEQLDVGDLDAIQTREEHLALYCRRDMLDHIAFLLSDHGEVALTDLRGRDVLEDLRTIVARLAERGLELFGVEVTTEDVAEAGFHVMRALAPGLQPLYFGSRLRYLGGTRVYEVPRRLGYTTLPTREEDLNPDPHPFP